MEENANLLELLFERATDYGKTSIELVKLKALGKTADLVSSIIPISVFIILVFTILLFLNIGIAFWLGEVLGKVFYGFFVVAAFYILTGLIFRLFLNNWIKKLVGDYFIKRILK
jgi:hypothetical protein